MAKDERDGGGVGAWLASVLSRRVSAGRRLIPEIDGLRSLAILSVVAFHAAGNFAHYTDKKAGGGLDDWTMHALRAGEWGVPLFFVISGFILALPFARYHMGRGRAPSLRRYIVRRLTRLEPPYLFALTVYLLKLLVEQVLLPADLSAAGPLLQHYLASFVYLHNAIFGQASRIAVVAWSLEVEVQFYILAPLLTYIFAVRSVVVRRVVLGLAIVGMSWGFGVDVPFDGLSLLAHAPYFLAGLLLADLYLAGDGEGAGHVGWDVVSMVSLTGVFVVGGIHHGAALLAPWLILLGYWAVFRARWVRGLFRATPVVLVGGMCYTIYLWHYLVIAGFRIIFFKTFEPEPTLLWRLGYIAASFVPVMVVSALLFVLVERPTMDPEWPARLAARIGFRRARRLADHE